MGGDTIIPIIILLITMVIFAMSAIRTDSIVELSAPFCPNATYLLWTGGYDSTARLCELVIINRVMVQPVYIMAPNTDFAPLFGIFTRSRENIDMELAAMENIRGAIIAKYPWARELILPTVRVVGCEYNDEIRAAMRSLAARGAISRSTGQYGAFAMVANTCGVMLEECAEKGPDTILGKEVAPYVVWRDGVYVLDDSVVKYPHDLHIFRNLTFPIIDKTKADLLEEAKYWGYDDILGLTVSCWYPVARGGKKYPCGKCNMCRERIIEQKIM